MTGFVWLRQEFPWLGGGFIHAVDTDYAREFGSALEGQGFQIIKLDCSSDDDLFLALGTAFQFPSYYGGSGWDAVNDCLSDIDHSDHFAIFWTGADSYAAADPKKFGEACSVLDVWLRRLSVRHIQGELVLVGRGRSFTAPDQ